MPEPDAVDEPTATGLNHAADQVGAAQRSQQLKLLRVLRHIVLPEVVPRVLG